MDNIDRDRTTKRCEVKIFNVYYETEYNSNIP